MKTSNELRGDTEAAVDFLEAFRPGGPWYLVAIDPLRRGPIEGRKFEDREATKAFIDRREGNVQGRNRKI